MLLVPFFTGMGIAWRINSASLLLLLSVLFLFLARQPLLLFLQSKFSKPSVEEEDGRRFLFWSVFYGLLGLLFAAPLFLNYRLNFLLLFGTISFLLFVVNLSVSIWQLKTRWAWEISGVLVLSLTASVSHYVAKGSLTGTAFLLWLLNFPVLLSSVFYMRMRARASRREKEFGGMLDRLRFWKPCLLYHSLLLIGVLALSFFGKIPSLSVLAYTPLIVRGIGGNLILKNGNLNLSKLGRKEMVYWMLFGGFLVLSFHKG